MNFYKSSLVSISAGVLLCEVLASLTSAQAQSLPDGYYRQRNTPAVYLLSGQTACSVTFDQMNAAGWDKVRDIDSNPTVGKQYIDTCKSSPTLSRQSTRPYIVLVNGYQNCCTSSVAGSLPQNAEIRAVPYSNFSDGGSSGNTSDDSAFLRDGADFINNQLDRNRPLILIGHSFGGDSVLKLLPRINRRIQFVAVIDPVRTGGFRASLKALNVPSNVNYFFNRWQENVPFPNDFVVNGSIPCNAGTCDQDSQNIARNADFSPVTTECRWDEVTCPGFLAPNPFIGRKGRKGTKQVRVSHQDLPKDAFIQKDLSNKIQRQIAAFSP
jgi:pimeloyl-ACP methyl ester carboxylesterase